MIYALETHRHVGDHVLLTGAVRNVRAAHPEMLFSVPEGYGEIFANNPDYTLIYADAELSRITYGTVEEERRAANGNLVEGFTRSLCAALDIPPVPITTKTPVICLTAEEWAQSRKWNGKWLINATFQTCGWSKGYPWWREVADTLRQDGFQLVQIGGNEARDISCNLGVEDMRGKTSLRDLCAMCAGCDGIITPPSCSQNIGAAFGTRTVCVVGGRELPELSGYGNTAYIANPSPACGWGEGRRCVSLRLVGGRACLHHAPIDGIEWCDCMTGIDPMQIVRAVEAMEEQK